MQHRNRTDHIHATAQIDGQNGLQTVSLNESLNHLLNHYHIGAGSRITLTRLGPACRPHAADKHSPTYQLLSPNTQTNNGFGHHSTVAPTVAGPAPVIHLMKMADLLMDNIRYA
jgi:hypothetical protein